MTYLECIHQLRAMLPNLIGLLFMMGLLGAGVIAVRTSPREQPADRHFVLFLSVCGVGAVFLIGLLVRLLPNVKPVGDLITAEPVVLILAGAWALGLVVLLLRLTYGWIVLQSMWLFAPRVSEGDPLWPVLQTSARHVGLRRLPRVAFSRRCRSPLAFGVGNPCVLLPASLRDRPEHELRDVVTHEFAHVCCRDCGAQLLVQIVGSLLWWTRCTGWRPRTSACCGRWCAIRSWSRATPVQTGTRRCSFGLPSGRCCRSGRRLPRCAWPSAAAFTPESIGFSPSTRATGRGYPAYSPRR